MVDERRAPGERLGLRLLVRRWWPSAWTGAVAVVVLASGSASGPPEVASGLVAGGLLVLALLLSPLAFPRSRSDAEAQERSRELEVPVVYWRPGCVFCLRLRLALGRVGNRAVWVDVTRDPDASAAVREVNGGDETVPTVFVGGSARTNPPPAWVREHLTAR